MTGQKPESKLWYAQGTWWAAMVVPTTGAHDVFRLVGGTWVDTGVLIDAETTTREDVLWDGQHLYVLSRTPTTAESSRLRRFSWVDGAYKLDSGFPVTVAGGGAEAETLAKGSTGTLWVAYASSDRVKKVMVAHSLGSDQSWGAPFALPLTAAQGLRGDDIAAVIAFSDASGPAIGIAWDNENLQSDFFAIHRDSAPDSNWSVEATLSGPLQADDHMNLKTFEGRVYIAVKTATTTAIDPLIKLLVRSPTGNWAQYPVATYGEHNTRPVVLIDTSARQLYIFTSKGDSPAHGILYKQSPLDAIAFPGSATPFVVGPANETINDGTSTKQNVDAGTGIVVLASDGSSYWWNSLGGGSPPPPPPPPPPPNTAPAADFVASTTVGVPVTVTLRGSDAESCELAFAITQPPSSGTVGSPAGAPCAAGAPNTDTATVVYTPQSGFSGSDTFTYQVDDGQGGTASATATVTVNGSQGPPSSTTAGPVSIKVTTGTLVSGDTGGLSGSGPPLQVASTAGNPPKTDWYGTFQHVPATVTSLTVAFAGSNSADCAQTVEIRNWITASWALLDSRTVGSSGVSISSVAPPGSLADYVDSSGQVRVIVSCVGANRAGGFTAQGNTLTITYGT